MGNRVLVILGMHRSGTSVITHWLQACGLHVGETLLGAGVGNVEGHFEDLELYRFHRGWLERNRLPHTGFVHAPVPPLSNERRQALRRIIDARNARFESWGWKEPRTCLFLDAYRELLPDARYLVVFRDFRASVGSMILRIRRQKDHKYARAGSVRRWLWFRLRRPLRWRRLLRRDASRFVKVWIFYNRQILALLGGPDRERCVVVDCGTLLRNDRKVFDTLAGRWAFPLHYVPFRDIHKSGLTSTPLPIDDHVDPALLREAEALQAQLAQRVLGGPDGMQAPDRGAQAGHGGVGCDAGR